MKYCLRACVVPLLLLKPALWWNFCDDFHWFCVASVVVGGWLCWLFLSCVKPPLCKVWRLDVLPYDEIFLREKCCLLLCSLIWCGICLWWSYCVGWYCWWLILLVVLKLCQATPLQGLEAWFPALWWNFSEGKVLWILLVVSLPCLTFKSWKCALHNLCTIYIHQKSKNIRPPIPKTLGPDQKTKNTVPNLEAKCIS